MRNSIIRYGVAGGLAVTCYVYTLSYTGIVFSTAWYGYLGYLAIVIMPICTFLALRDIRRRQPDKKLAFMQSLITGILVSGIAATVNNLYSLFDHQVLGNPYLKRLIEETRREMMQQGETAAVIEARIAKLNMHYESWQPYINTYGYFIVLGAVYSIVIHFIFKIKKP